MHALQVFFALIFLTLFAAPSTARETRVFILAGQSNMVGTGNPNALPESLKALPKNVSLYWNGWKPTLAETNRFGVEVGLAHDLSTPDDDRPILLVKFAVDGTSLLAWSPNWHENTAELTKNKWAGNLYKRLLREVSIATADTPFKLEALIWVQGESDAKYPIAGNQYLNHFSEFIYRLREDLNAPYLPVLYAQVNPPCATHPACDTVRYQQAQIEQLISNTKMISTDGLSKNSDNLHYDTNGQLELGRRFGAAYRAFKPSYPQGWPSQVREILYPSSGDRSLQPALFYAPTTQTRVPLLVALHSWSTDYKNAAHAPCAEWCMEQGWAFIHPNFRGPNHSPQATGSPLVLADILSAVEAAQAKAFIDTNRIYLFGSSGGGYTALLVAGKAPHLWAAVSVAVPIVDLNAWYEESRRAGRKYADDIVRSCGGAPNDSPAIQREYFDRSPIHFLKNAQHLPIDLSTGIHDGYSGSVPISHSLRAFNELADAPDRLSEADMLTLVTTQSVPAHLQSPIHDADYGNTAVLFRRSSNRARLTLFDGGHDTKYLPALKWFLGKAKR
jgi:pimeloyl-ACP methyl ester carboxylesterase